MNHLLLALSASLALVAVPALADQTIELKDGGKIVIADKGTTYHVDAKGKRVKMKDGVVMEAKDGQKYAMRNDALWKQITEKGTAAPNR